jgi:Ser/Thr protein kinase RdoA (MazF antagonist)
MSVNFSKIDGPWPVGPVPEPRRNGNGAGAAKGADFARDLSVASALPSPPPEVGAEVQDAARAAARLHELGRELRFGQGDDGRLQVELRDHDGNVLRQVPTAEIFDFAAGTVTS